jgi:hypothetical protein
VGFGLIEIKRPLFEKIGLLGCKKRKAKNMKSKQLFLQWSPSLLSNCNFAAQSGLPILIDFGTKAPNRV